METLPPVVLVGLVLVTVAWLALRCRHRGPVSIGLLGALLSLPALAAWAWPAHIPWVWSVPRIPVSLWVGGLLLLGIGLLPDAARGAPPPRTERACHVIALALSAGAFLLFLWMATVSPGGV